MKADSDPKLPPKERSGDPGTARTHADLPPIYVTSRDARRLRALISSKRAWLDEGVRKFLAQEIDRAVECSPEEIAPDVATMNSRILFRRQAGEGLECRTLVYDDAAVIGPSVCVFTPVGAALLGLRAGSRMLYDAGDAERALLVVEEIAYQPEARERHRRDSPRRWMSTVS